MSEADRVRLDRWLWAARFFKTRAQAKTAIEGGRVQFHIVGGSRIRPKVGKEITIGDVLTVRRGIHAETVLVSGLAEKRGDAGSAAKLYRETAQSIEAREAERARHRLERLGLNVPVSKPSKRERRALQKLKHDPSSQ